MLFGCPLNNANLWITKITLDIHITHISYWAILLIKLQKSLSWKPQHKITKGPIPVSYFTVLITSSDRCKEEYIKE